MADWIQGDAEQWAAFATGVGSIFALMAVAFAGWQLRSLGREVEATNARHSEQMQHLRDELDLQRRSHADQMSEAREARLQGVRPRVGWTARVEGLNQGHGRLVLTAENLGFGPAFWSTIRFCYGGVERTLIVAPPLPAGKAHDLSIEFAPSDLNPQGWLEVDRIDESETDMYENTHSRVTTPQGWKFKGV